MAASATKLGMRWPWTSRKSLPGERLPYRTLIDENIVLLRDGSVMLTLAVPGLASPTGAADEPDVHAGMRQVMPQGALGAGLVLYHHIIRRRVEIDLDGGGSDPLSQYIDARWRAQTSSRAFFIDERFITLVRRPARGRGRWLDRISLSPRKREAEADPVDIFALRTAAQAMLGALAAAGARLLGDYEGVGGTCSEVLEVLSALYNGEMRPVRRPAEGADIGNMLPYRRACFGLDAMELRGVGNPGFAAMLSLKDYPGSMEPSLTQGILSLPCELVLTESYANGDIALELGLHHLSVLVRHEDLAGLDEKVSACAAALTDAGAIAVREDVDLEVCFWAQLPGNEAFILRRAPVSSAEMAFLASLHGFSVGLPSGNHWGNAVSLFSTTNFTPYFFNFHYGDLGNFAVIGPPGSGKTVLMNFLAAQAQKFGPRTIVFDRNGASEVLRGIGGDYHRIAAGNPAGLNPLALSDTPANRRFLHRWLGFLLGAQDAAEEAAIASTIDALYAIDPSLRRLVNLRELLATSHLPTTGDLASRLDEWTTDGEQGWLLDNAQDRIDLSRPRLGFDLTELLEAPRLCTPVMMYLLHRINEHLDGNPAMILFDEAWKALDDEVLTCHLGDWLESLRNRNALFGFSGQSSSVFRSRISRTLLEQTATMIFTPNSRARADEYCDGFGLDQRELEMIRQLPAKGRCFVVRQGGESVVVRFDLSHMPEVVAILSGRKGAMHSLDDFREGYRDEPETWYLRLTGQPWPIPDGSTRNDHALSWEAAAE